MTDKTQTWFSRLRRTLTRQPPALNLALQGGGAHGAFTWGVLDALLAEPRLTFDGIPAQLIATQGEAAVFMTGLLGDRMRSAVLGAARDLAGAILGESALAALQATGTIGVSLLLAGFVLTAVGTVAGIRRLATAGRGNG